jgi:hypothetical protein
LSWSIPAKGFSFSNFVMQPQIATTIDKRNLEPSLC